MHNRQRAFTLVELLIVIATIAILSGLVISMITNATADTRMAVARQQQATLQEALHAWIASQPSVAGAQTAYNNASSKLNLVKNYLQKTTYDELNANSSATQIKSSAMLKAGVYLQFSTWNTSTYPTVEMIR